MKWAAIAWWLVGVVSLLAAITGFSAIYLAVSIAAFNRSDILLLRLRER